MVIHGDPRITAVNIAIDIAVAVGIEIANWNCRVEIEIGVAVGFEVAGAH